MANAFIKPTVIVSTALGLLQREIVIPNLVWTDGLGDFAGAYNDTVSIRVPGSLTAHTRVLRGTGGARNLTMDSLTETKVDVTLDTDVYSAVPVTDEELTLDISDFGGQVLTPQIRAVAEGLENGLVDSMRSANYAGRSVAVDPANTYDSFVDARKILNDANVPFAMRAAVIGSGIEAAILKDPNFKHADQAGSDDALREAKIGRIAGFDVYTSNALDDDEGYVFHKTAFAMVMRAPKVPDGASFGQSQAFQGLAMRWLRDYDFTTTTDRSLVDTFVGFKPITENDGSFVRAVRLQYLSASLDVTPATVTLAVGAKQTLVSKDAGGDTIPNKGVTWTTSDATKATVSTAGVITAVASGSATITGTYQGHTDTCVVTVS